MSEYYIITKTDAGVTCDTPAKEKLRIDSPDDGKTVIKPEWGTDSEGSRVLAFCLLRHAFGSDETAANIFKDFNSEVLGGIILGEWRIGKAQLHEYANWKRSPQIIPSFEVSRSSEDSARYSKLWRAERPVWLDSLNSSLALPN